jgi:hypothetical protein
LTIIGVVITFDENEKTCLLSIDAPDLQALVGKKAFFELTKQKVFDGTVAGVEDDFLLIKFTEVPLGLGQGSQVHVLDE